VRPANDGNADQIHALEIRVRASAGTNLSATVQGPAPVNFARTEALARRLPWPLTTPLKAGDEFNTYVLTSSVPLNMARAQQLLIRPTDAADATFEIESVRLITEREHLASVKSGVGWQGLKDIFREALVSRAPETIRFDVDVPRNARLELALGTMEDQPPTFKVTAGTGDSEPRVLLEQTVTTPHRWESQAIDLAEYGGRKLSLALTLSAPTQGTLGLWGTPVIRTSRGDNQASTPRGVILIQADTLRADHLGLYGHARDTAPFLARLAKEGAMFRHAFAQSGWTKVSTTSFLTSLYPTTHGVRAISDRLPAAATTIAEVYRAAGYATVSFSSVQFTGQATNLHQGFEELHERTSVDTGQYVSKTSRDFVDRAGQWIERHADAPFFMYLHVFDPHSPFEPRRPWDGLWADPTKREEHLRQLEAMRKVIANPFMADRGMATRDEMIKAGVDPAVYLPHEKDWYDGSIRGLDAELARLFQGFQRLGLDRDVAVVFLSDHGEEFQEHGRMWHGQSVYGEMMHVPLVVRWPAGLEAGRVIDEPVQLVDVMPTLLDLSGLGAPRGIHGQSLTPLLRSASNATTGGWKRRAVILEKQPMGGTDHPEASEAVAIIDGGWKLIHNKVRPADRPEHELYEFPKDRLDRENVAAQHPEVVQRLSKALNGWHSMASAQRLKPDAETAKALSAEELQRLRSLGYVR
jgi:arylsulfatase A-like enzyme